MRVTQPFDFAQGHESFDLAQDRELVERPVEWQMGVFDSFTSDLEARISNGTFISG